MLAVGRGYERGRYLWPALVFSRERGYQRDPDLRKVPLHAELLNALERQVLMLLPLSALALKMATQGSTYSVLHQVQQRRDDIHAAQDAHERGGEVICSAVVHDGRRAWRDVLHPDALCWPLV